MKINILKNKKMDKEKSGQKKLCIRKSNQKVPLLKSLN